MVQAYWGRVSRPPPPTPTRVILVGMQHTPEAKTLHFAEKEIEVIRQILPRMNITPVESR